MPIKDKIFVVGYPRSGTTMMAGILASNAVSEATPETNYINEFLAERISRFNFKFESKDLAEFPRISDMGMDMPNGLDSSQGYVTCLSKLLDEFKFVVGVDYVIEKTPRHYEYLKLILGMPDLKKVVVVMRDPRATILSNKKAGFRENKSCNWMALDWLIFSKIVRKYSSSGLVSVVKYEDVVAYPELTISKLYQYCGLPSEGYNPSLSSGRHVPDWEREWKNKDINPNSKSIDLWRSQLSEDDIEYIESVCCKEMRYWGYECDGTVSFINIIKSFFSYDLYFLKKIYKIFFVTYLAGRRF